MAQWILFIVFGVLVCKSSAATCAEFTNCSSCVSESSWSGNCRWCPWSKSCHAHGAILTNKCKSDANIVNVAQCDLKADNLCPNGMPPTEQGPRPGRDGCSGVPNCPLGLYCFTDCCNVHDDCYQTCDPLGGKEECDEEFEHCMTQVCDTLSAVLKIPCYENAELYRTGVNKLGTSAYLERQHQVCVCPARATSDDSSAFSVLSNVIMAVPVYGWILIGVASIFIFLGTIFVIYKVKTSKKREESV